jgi:ComF family protein
MSWLSWVWPQACVACGAVADGPLCSRCGAMRTRQAAVDGLDAAFCAAAYRGPVGAAVRRAKGSGDRELALWLSERTAEHLAPRLRELDAVEVVPVPATLRRRVVRGFDLPVLLAVQLAKRLDLPVRSALRRTRDRRQAALGRAQRAAQAAGMYRQRLSTSERVILVDDVVTSGATARACADELRGGQARSVWLATVCAATSGRDAPRDLVTMSDEHIHVRVHR